MSARLGCRAALFRRADQRGDRCGARHLDRHGDPRLADGKAVAAPGAKKGRSHLITDRWRRIESLCHAALARPAEDRAAYLAEACGGDEALREEVESLVAEGDADVFLEVPVVGGAVSPSLVGRELGPYRIEAPIEAGGMGEVYHAKDTA